MRPGIKQIHEARRFASEAKLYLLNHWVAIVPSLLLRQIIYKKWHNFKIGDGSCIFSGVWFYAPSGGLSIGINSVISERCRLDNRGGIVIGSNVSICAESCILTTDHDLNSPDFTARSGRIILEDHCFVGTRAIVLKGVRVGRGAVVASGAVVTRDVAPFTVVAGVPAKLVGRRQENLLYTCTYQRAFH